MLNINPVSGDSQLAYLLPRDRYGIGLYQEEPSSLAAGCLEAVADAMTKAIESLTGLSWSLCSRQLRIGAIAFIVVSNLHGDWALRRARWPDQRRG